MGLPITKNSELLGLKSQVVCHLDSTTHLNRSGYQSDTLTSGTVYNWTATLMISKVMVHMMEHHIAGSGCGRNSSSHLTGTLFITLGDILLRKKKQQKYLGHILHERGLSTSVEATVKAMEAKTNGRNLWVESSLPGLLAPCLGAMWRP